MRVQYVLGLLALGAGLCLPPKVIEASELDNTQIKQIIHDAALQYTQKHQQRDAKGLAALFTTEGEYVDASGTVFHGRDSIEAEFSADFEQLPEGDLQLDIVSIRPIASGLISEEGIAFFQPKDQSSPVAKSRYTATHVQQADGGWLLASIRELESSLVSPHDRLVQLSWLLGQWQEDAGSVLVSTSWDWSEDGNYLISNFSYHDREGISLKGTQRIGWDAERKQFRSWIFNSNGSVATGWWSVDSDGVWSSRLSGVDVEGQRYESTLSYFREGKDQLSVTHHQRDLAGQQLEPLNQRLVRRPPAPEVTGTP